jgi:GTP-binding protein Era
MGPPDENGFISGFVTIAGRPNAGKSTLLNALVGTKLAIIADKPQTTRTTIQGILNTPSAQVIFLDTPGIHRADSRFNRRMMEMVRPALEDRDLLLYIADATQSLTPADEEALDLIRKSRTATFLLLNKIDRLKNKSALLPLIEAYRTRMEFQEIFPISALTGEGLSELKTAIIRRMPRGPQYFPPDQITDQPERFLAAEIVREKILTETRQEVPHSAAVLVDQWDDTSNLTRIAATIYVERPGQKAILIGAGGSMLKKVGTLARQELELLLGRRIFLELFVKVQPHWRENAEFLNALDWRSMAGTQEG